MLTAPLSLKPSPLTSRPFQAGAAVRPRPALRPRVARAPASQTVTRAAAKQAYICVDCGYIYDGSTPFDKLPGSYKCPVCNSPKRRFQAYAGGGRNDEKAMQARMKSMKGGGGGGASGGNVGVDSGDKSLLGAIAVGGAVLLAGLYFALNNSM